MALSIRTEFELDCPKSQAWTFLTDASLAVPCFPGAELGELGDDGFYNGSFGVKLGPMALRFGGKFKVEPLDEQAGTLRVQALGQDTKGRGTAKSDVNCQLIEAAGKTQVTVDSKVDLTGSIAQFGRAAGMIEVISKQLLLRFAANVKSALVLAPASEAAAGAAGASGAVGAVGADGHPSEPVADSTPMSTLASASASTSVIPEPFTIPNAPGTRTPPSDIPAANGPKVQQVSNAPARITLWEKFRLWLKKW